MRSADSNLLARRAYSDYKGLGKSMLHPMGFIKCRNSTKAKVNVEDFEEKNEQFVLGVLSNSNYKQTTLLKKAFIFSPKSTGVLLAVKSVRQTIIGT